VAINGHGSSGKTSLSRQLSAVLPDCSVLHTDDLAWHHGVFAWDELLIKNVLPALRDGHPLQYRRAALGTCRPACRWQRERRLKACFLRIAPELTLRPRR
jgi:hypothetical protein